MAKIKKKSDPKHAQLDDKIVKPNTYLETDKAHKDWFDSEVGMGKQRGKPRAVPSNVKKPKGRFEKHPNASKH